MEPSEIAIRPVEYPGSEKRVSRDNPVRVQWNHVCAVTPWTTLGCFRTPWTAGG